MVRVSWELVEAAAGSPGSGGGVRRPPRGTQAPADLRHGGALLLAGGAGAAKHEEHALGARVLDVVQQPAQLLGRAGAVDLRMGEEQRGRAGRVGVLSSGTV